jgi:hypothetical protein
MNYQEIFNKVSNHLLVQNEKSASTERSVGYACYYRYNGLKCAFGALIPDELYSKDLEGETVLSVLLKRPALNALLGIKSGEDREFLAELQRIHDAISVDRWPAHLEYFANKYRLKA